MTAINSNCQMGVWLCQIVVFLVVIASVGACRMQECRLLSGASSNYRRIGMETARDHEKQWAERLDLSGVPNLYKVSDDLYRGAQPSAEGMKQLEKLGIKTVVNLRFIHSDRSKIKGTGLDYEHINMTTLYVKTSDVVRFLKIVTDCTRTPVFVHCQHGIDRAGTMCAVYRMVVQGWSREEALEEMTKGSFAYRCVQKTLVNYIRKLDVDEIKRGAALNE